VGQWLVLGLFGGWGTSDTLLARQKLGKKTHPNHGDRHRPTAAMVPSSWHCHIKQLANMLRNKSMLLKLENNIVFTIYELFKAQRIIKALSMSSGGEGSGVGSGKGVVHGQGEGGGEGSGSGDHGGKSGGGHGHGCGNDGDSSNNSCGGSFVW
jgi:hypothetical protein